MRQRTFDLKQALKALRSSEQSLAKTQRLSAVGTMASGIAHDFNNALMLIMGSGEILLSDAERQRLTKENAIPLLQRYPHRGARRRHLGRPTPQIFQIGRDRRSASAGRSEFPA